MVRQPIWIPAYIGLGSNLDDPPAQLRGGLAALARLPATYLVAESPFYRNPPFGMEGQPDFVNAAAALLTQLSSMELLTRLREIETTSGRKRDPANRWGPRVLDLDLLMYGNLQQADAGLTLPHPGISERNFVLFPLLDIAPGLHVPGQGPLMTLAARLSRDGLERVSGADAAPLT
jgi:2-amino-4-hydroxy-6-hydroxymethyldihydropteridine diphosphokinase